MKTRTDPGFVLLRTVLVVFLAALAGLAYGALYSGLARLSQRQERLVYDIADSLRTSREAVYVGQARD